MCISLMTRGASCRAPPHGRRIPPGSAPWTSPCHGRLRPSQKFNPKFCDGPAPHEAAPCGKVKRFPKREIKNFARVLPLWQDKNRISTIARRNESTQATSHPTHFRWPEATSLPKRRPLHLGCTAPFLQGPGAVSHPSQSTKGGPGRKPNHAQLPV